MINGNSDFQNQASLNGWDGDGSESTPFSIYGLNITNSSLIPLISISNTDVHFNITSGFLSGGSYGIQLHNVTNGLIWDNSITGAIDSGISITQSEDIWIDRNEIYGNSINGIEMSFSNDSTIFNATIGNNGECGIVADNTIDIEIEECHILSNGQDGVKVRDGHHNRILENHIYSNGPSYYGIKFGNAHHNIVSENYIHDNSHGIENGASNYNNFTHNAIYDNTGIGLTVLDHSLIEDNIFYHNQQWALRCWGTNTTVTYNNFIDNNLLWQPFIQVHEDGTNNFTYNFWSHWTIPDENDNGIVDIPMTSGGVTDNYPLIEVVVNTMLHLLTNPILIYPNTDYYIRGDVNITWGMASDTYGHEVQYSIEYSLNNGSTWMLIQDEVDDTYYIWDTSGVSINQYSLIRVNATCTTGLNSSDSSDNTFAIANIEHSISTPNFIHPVAGDPYSGNLLVEWEEAVDSWYMPITYELYYLNSSAEWVIIDDNIEATSFAWDTSSHPDGEMTLKVIAKNPENNQVNATSGVFIIDNIPDEDKIPGFSIFLIIGFSIPSIFGLLIIVSRKQIQK